MRRQAEIRLNPRQVRDCQQPPAAGRVLDRTPLVTLAANLQSCVRTSFCCSNCPIVLCYGNSRKLGQISMFTSVGSQDPEILGKESKETLGWEECSQHSMTGERCVIPGGPWSLRFSFFPGTCYCLGTLWLRRPWEGWADFLAKGISKSPMMSFIPKC